MYTSCHNIHAGRLHFVAGKVNVISLLLEIKQLHLHNITKVQIIIMIALNKQMHKTLATYMCLCYCLQLYMHATQKIIQY